MNLIDTTILALRIKNCPTNTYRGYILSDDELRKVGPGYSQHTSVKDQSVATALLEVVGYVEKKMENSNLILTAFLDEEEGLHQCEAGVNPQCFPWHFFYPNGID